MRVARLRSLLLVTCHLSLVTGFASCAHKYSAPDPARVIAATKKVEASAAAAHASHQQERAKMTEAQAAADSITVASQTLLQKIESLAKIAPPELQPPLAEIHTDVTDLQAKETVLTTGLVKGWQMSDATEKHLVATDANVAALKREQAAYYDEAVKRADKASADAIADNKKIWWYRAHFWGSWIALGAGVIACVVFAIIKWGAKWSAKAGLAAARSGI